MCLIRTKRITIRELNQSDLSFYQALYADKELMQYIGEVLDKSAGQKYFDLTLKYMSQDPRPMVLFVICDNMSHARIGVVGLRWNQRCRNKVEIGVIIKKQFHRKKIGHEAKSLVINYAFDHLDITEVIANCDEANIAANLANEKLGFTKVKTYISEKRQCATVMWCINKGVSS